MLLTKSLGSQKDISCPMPNISPTGISHQHIFSDSRGQLVGVNPHDQQLRYWITVLNKHMHDKEACNFALCIHLNWCMACTTYSNTTDKTHLIALNHGTWHMINMAWCYIWCQPMTRTGTRYFSLHMTTTRDDHSRHKKWTRCETKSSKIPLHCEPHRLHQLDYQLYRLFMQGNVWCNKL